MDRKPVKDIDDIPADEFFIELIKFFGPERAMALMGWSISLALLGVYDPPKIRKELEQKGLTKSSMYRALADFRRFGEHLEQQNYTAVDLKSLCLRIASLSQPSESVPLVGI
jgi:hypothetical protein